MPRWRCSLTFFFLTSEDFSFPPPSSRDKRFSSLWTFSFEWPFFFLLFLLLFGPSTLFYSSVTLVTRNTTIRNFIKEFLFILPTIYYPLIKCVFTLFALCSKPIFSLIVSHLNAIFRPFSFQLFLQRIFSSLFPLYIL